MPDRGCYMKLLLLIIKTFKPTLMCYSKARAGTFHVQGHPGRE